MGPGQSWAVPTPRHPCGRTAGHQWAPTSVLLLREGLLPRGTSHAGQRSHVPPRPTHAAGSARCASRWGRRSQQSRSQALRTSAAALVRAPGASKPGCPRRVLGYTSCLQRGWLLNLVLCCLIGREAEDREASPRPLPRNFSRCKLSLSGNCDIVLISSCTRDATVRSADLGFIMAFTTTAALDDNHAVPLH